MQSGITLSNRYLIQDIVGMGGMGAVYRARDLHFPKLMKLVAVKEMINQARDPLVRKTIVQNFEREANILATLHHPAIPRIFDYFSHGERSYLVMEYINGKNLEDILNELGGSLPIEQVLVWAIELCDVLQYLHSHQPEPIIFRDMKPSNVMINSRNSVILVDFGIAKHFQVGQRGTQVGTEGYSPPEQYRGEAGPFADIYALGATLHHLLTGKDPRLETPFSFGERPVRQYNQNVSMEFEKVVDTALSYNPEERFESAQVMKDALLSVARRTGALPAGVPFAGGVSSLSGSISEGSKVKPLWTFSCEDEIRGGIQFHQGIVYLGCYDNNLYAIDASNGEFVWKYPTEGGIVSKPAIAGNGIIVGSEDNRLHAIALRSGKVVWTYLTNGPIRSSPRIAEGHVFVGSDDGYLHAINVRSTRRSWYVDMGAAVRSTPFIANNLVYVGSESGDFYAIDFSGTVKWRFKAKRAITSSPVIVENTVYFTSVDWMLYALDAEAGYVLWKYRLGKPSISTPCVVDKNVIVGAIDGFIYCVDSGSGKEKWKYETGHQVTGSPVSYKDAVYIGSVDQYMYCLEYQSGRLRWKFQTEGPITGTPAVSDDVIYFGSNDHRLYALLA